MSSACWLEHRDAELDRARRLAESDPRAALAVVDRLLAEAPADLESLRARADILVEAGDAGEARRSLERVLALDPEDAGALVALADLERDADRALGLYDRALFALQARGATGGPDVEAARRGRAALLGARRAS
jgi:Tfp pilus assembly protein PilF